MVDVSWLPPEEWSLEDLKLQATQRRPRPRSATSDEGRHRTKRGSIAATPLPADVKGACSPERLQPELPQESNRRGSKNSRGKEPRSRRRSGSRSGSRSRAPSAGPGQINLEAGQRRLGRDPSRGQLDEDDRDERDSDPGLLPQVIPELPVITPAVAVVRQASAVKALQAELLTMQREFEEADCKVHLVDSDIFHWEVELTGPEGSPYHGGVFRFFLKFPADYPKHMPSIRCATPIYHCNIDRSGNVCLGAFDEDGLSPAALVPRRRDDSEAATINLSRIQLRVGIVNARSLRNADFGGTSDPYCSCQIPGKDYSRLQTAVVEDSLSPVWNEEHFINDYLPGDSLSFEVYDSDDHPFDANQDELLGRATLDSKVFFPAGFDGDLTLTDTGKSHRSTLHVKVSVIMPRSVHDRTTAMDVVEALLSLLALPVLDTPLVPEAARLFRENRHQYDHVAREWTLQYAL